MAELYCPPFSVSLASSYTAGASTISVSGAAPAAIQSGTFRVRLANTSNTVLKVTAGASTTTWTVTAEFNDANASSGATVYGCEFTPAMLTALLPVAAPPYLSINGTKYVAATMFPATLPDFTGYAYAQGTTTNTTGANGSVLMQNLSGSVTAHYLKTASASIEAEFLIGANGVTTTGPSAYYQGGIELFDSTNNQLYALQVSTYSNETGLGGNDSPIIVFQKIAYNGSTFSGTIVNLAFGGSLTGSVFHLRVSVSGGTLTAQMSMDGGQTWQSMATQSVGTISKAGLTALSNTNLTLLSLATS